MNCVSGLAGKRGTKTACPTATDIRPGRTGDPLDQPMLLRSVYYTSRTIYKLFTVRRESFSESITCRPISRFDDELQSDL